MSSDINSIFDQLGHQFAIGDIVASKGSGTSTVPQMKSWLRHEAEVRYLVLEQIANRCHGGIQRHYLVRPVRPDGNVSKVLAMNEPELVASEPFQSVKDSE